ncbi:LADA_0D07822g1_1 [Lachancea dasiensis]|uniref:LADA_0D07822g1_1 n=1 Tax=Lachancea dasiensis TaxID=1072105 RepID=A0A1G4J7C1_9SACH|nr:LADA_0D07822g1_1 [Lachancea dasiensis]
MQLNRTLKWCHKRLVPNCPTGKLRFESTSTVRGATVERLKIPIDQIKSISEPQIDFGLPIAVAKSRRVAKGARNVSNALPPTLQYVRDTMDRHKNYVVLTQMGSFYELYFEHAEIYAPKLNLTLTSREYTHGKVSFAGFPVHQIQRHLKVLVKDHGYSVAIADQFLKDSSITNETNRFLRRVTRIVTPGTFMDEAFENLQENTYLLSIEFPGKATLRTADIDMKIGLCWCDISTGEVYVQQVSLKDTVSAITRIGPREILLDEELMSFSLEKGEWFTELVELKKYFVKYQRLPSGHREMKTFYHLFNCDEEVDRSFAKLDSTVRDLTQKETAALRNILFYIEEHLPNAQVNLQTPQRQLTTSIMQIDSRTNSSLELTSTMRSNSRKGSLLSVIRRTVTPSGSRLLSQWLCAPSLNLSEIHRRQKLVKLFKENDDLMKTIFRTLKQTYDMPRILQKFTFGKGEATELLQLAHSLQSAGVILKLLQKASEKTNKMPLTKLTSSLISPLQCNEFLIEKVLGTLDEEQFLRSRKAPAEFESLGTENGGQKGLDVDPLGESSPWVVQSNASSQLQKLHKLHNELLVSRDILRHDLESFFTTKFQARTVQLKLKQSNEFAIHITASPSNIREIMFKLKEGLLFREELFRVIQKSAQTCWLSHESWLELGHELELTAMKIKKEESAYMNELKGEFVKRSSSIRRIAHTLDYLDVLTSFAKLSLEKSLTCPSVNSTTEFNVTSGRHIMVEDALSTKSLEHFTPNDCNIQAQELWIVTGPNMGGKSTFLRQNAIIAILAQIGCFVPCKSATIGLVDKIFSRMGSADDLYNEMSTFMVEMVETSYILNGATSSSLAILDEIGRGTSGKEGVSIAYATLKHLIERNKCRSLFATHFGTELQALVRGKCHPEQQQKISFYQSAVLDVGENEFYYDHRLTPGVCTQSDAIKVALRAGFPRDSLLHAEEVLKA